MEDSRTVFVAGLPRDVKERELTLLFREQPGFQGVVLRSDGIGRPLGFATFEDHPAAAAAIATLVDVVLDPASGEHLRLELARTSSRALTKRTRDGDAEVPPTKMSQLTKGPLVYGHPPPYHEIQMYGAAAYGEAPPASTTLFITGLGPNTSAAYMQEICAAFPGFDRLRVDREGEHNACCFVRFGSLLEAQTAMQQLHGCSLPTSANLRCEFARTDMGRKAAGPQQSRLPYAPTYPTPTSSTLFLSGLGESIGAADLVALCQPFPGYLRLKIDHEGQRNACCFVLFSCPADASYAMQHLAGRSLATPLTGSPVVLRCEFAKADLGARAVPDAKPPAPVNYHLDPYSFQRMVPQLFFPTSGGMSRPPFGGPAPGTSSSTLFVSGLGPDVTTDEMTGFCQYLPGFERLKLDHEGQPRACCFVKFADHTSAAKASTLIHQSPLRGKQLKVEFAKQDLGRKHGP